MNTPLLVFLLAASGAAGVAFGGWIRRYWPNRWRIEIFDGHTHWNNNPSRRLRGSCGLCGGEWTYRHPSQSKPARRYHHDYICTYDREAA